MTGGAFPRLRLFLQNNQEENCWPLRRETLAVGFENLVGSLGATVILKPQRLGQDGIVVPTHLCEHLRVALGEGTHGQARHQYNAHGFPL